MKTAILCTGDELLKGSTVNTNLAHMGAKLLENGNIPEFELTVPDRADSIRDALAESLKRADFVLVSGGLGPTADDLTKETVAQFLGFRLEQNSEAMVNILQYWKTRHRTEEIPPRVMNQSLVPEGAEVLLNRFGTAPGLILRTPGKHAYPEKTVILLPGPPGEFCPMFDDQVLPVLLKKTEERIHSKLFRLAGIGETEVEDRILSVTNRRHPLSAAFCAEPGLVRLFLTSPNAETLGLAIADVREIFREELLADSSHSLAEEIFMLLRKNAATFATAESCTGGLIAKQITDFPGSSDVFLGGIVSYANRIKSELLGVSEQTLTEHGAVSPETAREMVEGAVRKFGCDAAVALTGIAGPGGGTPEKPVGLVYAGIFWRGEIQIAELRLRRSREQIRECAAASALNLLRRMILHAPAQA